MHLRFITGRGRCDLLRDARVYHPTRHLDPERSEGEGPHSLHVIPTLSVAKGRDLMQWVA